MSASFPSASDCCAAVARKERKWHVPANHVNVSAVKGLQHHPWFWHGVTDWQAKYRGIVLGPLNQVRHAIELVLPAPNQEALLPGSMGNVPIISTIRGTLNVIPVCSFLCVMSLFQIIVAVHMNEHSQIPELLHADGAPFAKHDGLLQLFQYLRMKLIEREEAGLPRHQASVVAWLKPCLLTAHAVQP